MLPRDRRKRCWQTFRRLYTAGRKSRGRPGLGFRRLSRTSATNVNGVYIYAEITRTATLWTFSSVGEERPLIVTVSGGNDPVNSPISCEHDWSRVCNDAFFPSRDVRFKTTLSSQSISTPPPQLFVFTGAPTSLHSKAARAVLQHRALSAIIGRYFNTSIKHGWIWSPNGNLSKTVSQNVKPYYFPITLMA